MRFLFAAILALCLLSGCVSVCYVPDKSRQNREAGDGAVIDRYPGPLPVYSGPPPRPYHVLGSLSLTARRLGSRWLMGVAFQKAQALGADALILVDRRHTYIGSQNTKTPYIGPAGTVAGCSVSMPVYTNTISLFVIKWTGSSARPQGH